MYCVGTLRFQGILGRATKRHANIYTECQTDMPMLFIWTDEQCVIIGRAKGITPDKTTWREEPAQSRHRLVSSVGRAPVCCAGGRRFEPQTGPTLRVLK